MNVLVLTPDAVGSTLLQRMLTIYMQFHQFDRPVINLHELTNGIAKYYSPDFGREIVSKRQVKNWGYFQTLQEIVELLSSVDHYKTSRLASYHIVRRGDTMAQQIPFYNYLNENFYIIACRRSNVFEHALSMALSRVTKKLNVFDFSEKIDTFFDIYKSGIVLDTEVFVKQLELYRHYIQWSEQHFNICSYFNYEKDVPRLEQFILDLPVFANQESKISWDQNFGMGFNTWNQMNYVLSDLRMLNSVERQQIDTLSLANQQAVESYQKHAPEHWPPVFSVTDLNNLPTDLKTNVNHNFIQSNGLTMLMNPTQQAAVQQFKPQFDQISGAIKKMIDLDIIVTGPPIKKQQLIEKRSVIKNFNDLIKVYNDWAINNPDIASETSDQDITDHIKKESDFWQSIFVTAGQQPAGLPNVL
jgi:hypothetical protein